MEEKSKLVIVLAQESIHIVNSYWGKQRCIFPVERNHVRIGAVEKNMLIILDIISIIQVTGGGINYFDSMPLSQNVGCGYEV